MIVNGLLARLDYALPPLEGTILPHDRPLPLPGGEGGGEGVRTIREAISLLIARAHPLTLSLSPWERGPEEPILRFHEVPAWRTRASNLYQIAAAAKRPDGGALPRPWKEAA
jgi:hypothetical protein